MIHRIKAERGIALISSRDIATTAALKLALELPPKDRTCSGLRFRADELAWRLIP
ncbi:hypothetical protein GOD01_31690, partial [Sinorhizobium medicae]|nr:hypothetical protein [Sinorhizobium medicae]